MFHNHFSVRRLFPLFTASALALSLCVTGYAETQTGDGAFLPAPQTEDDPQYGAEYRKYYEEEEEEEQANQGIMLMDLTGDTFQYVSPYTGSTYTINGEEEDLALGVDVSYYQGTIDWAAAKEDGVEFAIIRAGYRGYGSAGTLVTDSQFYNNLAGAQEQDIPVGIYIYSQATTVEEAREEAEYVLALIEGYELELPIFFDQEFAEQQTGSGTAFTGRLYNAYSAQDTTEKKAAFLTDLADAFCDTISEAGYTPMIYASTAHFRRMDTTRVTDPVWVAQYSFSVTYEGSYAFWQYSSAGTVNGIPGYTDCNFSVDPAYLDCNTPDKQDPVSHIVIAPSSCPTGSFTAKSFTLTGTIISAQPLTKVSASIVRTDGTEIQSASQEVQNLTTFTIQNSALDQNLKFGDLTGGRYYLTYSAEDALGATKTWTSDVFTVLFPDVTNSSEWYYSHAYRAASLGLISGVGTDQGVLFCPNDELTRGQIVCMLYRAAGSPAVDDKTHPFTDAKESWYQTALAWAYHAGVVSGISKTEFSPDSPVTREQMAVMLYKLSGASPSETDSLSAYTDAGQVSSWAKTQVNWSISQGLLSSDSTDKLTFSPQSSATRAQAAVILSNYVEKYQ